MRSKNLLKTSLFTVLCAMPLHMANADAAIFASKPSDIIQDTGVANRLTVGEVLRSLTQEVPTAACHLANQVNVEDATDLLSAGVDQVDELLAALMDGDIFWGIELAEERPKTILEIEALRDDWTPVQAAARDLLDNHTNEAALAVIYGAADPLLDRTYRLLTTLDAAYSGSAEILKRDVMFIQLAGRMAALNQRLALDACLLSSNGPDAEIAADLTSKASQYDASLNALLDGLPAMGILPPQTPGIADKLEDIKAMWAQNSPVIKLIAVGEEITPDQRFALYYNMIDEHVAILDLVYLYQDHSKVH